MLENIQFALKSFSGGNLTENALNLFQTLGYESERRLPFEDKSFADFESYIAEDSRFSEKNALASEWRYVDLLFQLTESELERQNLLFENDKTVDQRIASYLFFVVELTEANYSRTALSRITREVNKVFEIPVMVLFKYGELVTLAVIDRQPHKRDESKDVLRKVTLVKDINFRQTHRAHLDVLNDLSLPEIKSGFTINSFLDLHNAWQKKLDVELVTNNFFRDYKKVFERVETEIEKSIRDKEAARLFNQRLFNRLMFVYFVQKKNWLAFEGSSNYLRALFDKAEAGGENFFRERLYWVFFYGLGTNIESRELHGEPALRERRGVVPYLNGGLFEMEKDGCDERGKVTLENSLFADVLDLFEHYNFTVEESTPLEVQVAIDPEILGRVFEELVTGRHESGSYYTPRQIVSFMCRESLKHYLAAHDTAETIAEFVDEGIGENLSEPEQILDALKKIRICDPACGSGAYLLGMMQELLRLRDALFTSKHLGDASLYSRKREIIENNIYGVDIDRFAVQIASLRLWLSLAIESKEPRPLPNLKYKIGCGDSLLAPLENDSQPDLHRRALIEQFRARKTEYSSASEHIKKSEIDREIERLRIEIAQSLHHLPEPPKPYQISVAETQVQPLRDKVQRLIKEGNKFKAESEQKNLNKLLTSIEDWKQQIEPKPYTPDFFDWTVEFAEIFEPEMQELQKPAQSKSDSLAGENAFALQKPARSKGATGATDEERPYFVALQKPARSKGATGATDEERPYFVALQKPARSKGATGATDEERPYFVALQKPARSKGATGATDEERPYFVALQKPARSKGATGATDEERPYFVRASAKGGFDIILANPPYIRQELLGKDYKEKGLRPNFAEVYSGTADIYVYFFARANQMLKPNGVGCFISSNKWLRAGYGEKLRQLLLDRTKFHLVVDFGDLPVFKATAYPSIFLWQNAEREETPTAWAEVKDLELCYQDGVRQHISEIAHILPAEQFGTGKPRIATTANTGSHREVEVKGQLLKEYINGKIYNGIKTGLNEAFVIDLETRNRLIAEDNRSAEIIKPLFEGDDVRKYETHFRESYLIWTYVGVEINKYPSVFAHLQKHEIKAKQRYDKGREWWELRHCAYYDEFNGTKIIYPQISLEPRFFLDNGSFFINQKCFMIPSSDWYLLAVLNSSFVWQLIKKGSPALRGGYSEPRKDFILNLPIPNASDEEREAIAKLARETQNLHTERRGKVEQFLRDIGTSAADSTSRNPLEQVWTLTEAEFLKRTKSRFDASIFHHAKSETFALTERITRIEREIDERVAELYGVKIEAYSGFQKCATIAETRTK